MQVARPPEDLGRTKRTRSTLSAFLRKSEIAAPVCGDGCPHFQTSELSFDCSRSCVDAQRALSCEPDRFPIEPKIAPLVFEIQRLGVFYPCWSCEGHLDKLGKLWRLPAVWFYCEDLTHVRLLADGVADLHAKDILKSPWQVRLGYTDGDVPDTAFALEPFIEDRSGVLLETLQVDISTLAREMQSAMRQQAQELLWGLDK